MTMMEEASELARLREENARLRGELARLPPGGGGALASQNAGSPPIPSKQHERGGQEGWVGGAGGQITPAEIERYSRQMLLPAIGVQVQAKLLKSAILVVGAGGLGSPAALYLAGAGIGRLGIADHDAVEVSNLHRQVIHREDGVGRHKASSAAASCRALNSGLQVEEHLEGLTQANALAIVSQYDVVIDASDNAPTRYLISDACVVARKPLVSGAALGLEGQLTVYNHGEDGPCYRCLFPTPAAPDSCQRCADAGVLGVVPGVVGTLQALEAIKIAGGFGDVLSRKLLLFDATSTRFHTVRLRGKDGACVACGSTPRVTAGTFAHEDYLAFTGQAGHDGAPPPLCVLQPGERADPRDFHAKRAGEGAVLLDVREPHHFEISAIPGSINIPLKQLGARIQEVRSAVAPGAGGGGAGAAGEAAGGVGGGGPRPLYVVCRRGNDSQLAVEVLRGLGLPHAVDLRGGLEGWRACVDPSFPTY